MTLFSSLFRSFLPCLVVLIFFSGCATRIEGTDEFTPMPANPLPQDLNKLFPKADFALPSNEALIRKVPASVRYEGIPRDRIPDLISRIQAGFSMPNLNSEQVDRFINQYAKQAALERTLLRGQYFLYDIVVELEKRNMPTELALLPIVESSFNTQARSHASAVGVWQFISSTGIRFGLRQTPWLDERQHTHKATIAALEYLNWLYDQFGNWHLALAGYNCGEYCVQRALKKIGVPYSTLTYDDLPIPRETQQYAPRLQALKEIILDPKKYGLKLPLLPNHVDTKPIIVDVPIRGALAAKLADISIEEFNHLNAHLRQGIYHPNLNTSLILPADSIETFRANLLAYEDLGDVWVVHHAKKPESLMQIANHYGSSLPALKSANPQWTKNVVANSMVVVPIERNAENATAVKESGAVRDLPVITMAKETVKKSKASSKLTLKKRPVVAGKQKQLAKRKLAIREKYVAPKPLTPEQLRKQLTSQKKLLNSTKSGGKVMTKPNPPLPKSKPATVNKPAPKAPNQR